MKIEVKLNNDWGLRIAVFLLTMLLFVGLYDTDYELAEQHITSPRFNFYRIMWIEGICGFLLAWKCWPRFRFVPLDGVVALLGTYAVARYFWGGDMLEYLTGLFVLLIMLYFIMRMLSTLIADAPAIMCLVLVLVCCYQAIYGFTQLYGWSTSGHPLFRLTGSFFNPGPYSGFLAILLPMVWIYFIDQKNQWFVRYGAGFVFLFGLSLLPAGMSRASWVALFAGCFIVSALYYRFLIFNFRKIRKKVIGYIIVGFFLLVVAALGLYALKKDSADGRRFMWKISTLAMEEKPWTGLGLGYFGGAYGKAQAEYFASGQGCLQELRVAGAPEYGFNEYLQLGVELGIIGLLLFVMVFIVAIWQLVAFRPPEWLGILGGLISFSVFACFSYPLSIISLCEILVLFLAMSANIRQNEEKQERIRVNRSSVLIIAMGTVCLGITYFLTKDKEEKRKAYVLWNEEQKYFRMNIFEGTADNYRKLYFELKEEPRFLFEYGQCLSKIGLYKESNRILDEGIRLSADPMFFNIMGKNYQELTCYKEAENCFREAENRVPNRLYPRFLLVKMYLDNGWKDEGKRLALEFLQKEPKVMSEAVREMREEIERRIK